MRVTAFSVQLRKLLSLQRYVECAITYELNCQRITAFTLTDNTIISMVLLCIYRVFGL